MKKALALILALAMVFALCACGQSSAPTAAATEAPAAVAIVGMCLVVIRHRDNIKRLISGTEPDFKPGKSKRIERD